MKKKILTFLSAMSVAAVAGAAPMAITGAGSSFVYPAMTKWFEAYAKVSPDVQFNYQSIGSGAGIQQITVRTVDFGATDGPMTQDQMATAPGRIYHIPVVMGAVAVTYNLDGVKGGLKLTPDVLADIYLGKITSWNDSRIASANPGTTLPNVPIVVVHRSDGSGTSFIFTDYLSSVSSEWKSKVGKGTSVNWPVGLGGKGNEGVSGAVKQTPGGIGYTELAYAIKNNLTYANLQNKSGNFIEPTLDSTSKAADGVVFPDDFRVSIVNTTNPDGYPICGFSWVLIYKNMPEATKGKAIVSFLRWAVHDGQALTKDLLYAPLPSGLVEMIDKKLDQVK